jgi:hypothetical protein
MQRPPRTFQGFPKAQTTLLPPKPRFKPIIQCKPSQILPSHNSSAPNPIDLILSCPDPQITGLKENISQIQALDSELNSKIQSLNTAKLLLAQLKTEANERMLNDEELNRVKKDLENSCEEQRSLLVEHQKLATTISLLKAKNNNILDKSNVDRMLNTLYQEQVRNLTIFQAKLKDQLETLTNSVSVKSKQAYEIQNLSSPNVLLEKYLNSPIKRSSI